MSHVVQVADGGLVIHNHLQSARICADLFQVHDGHLAHLRRRVVQLRYKQLQRPVLDRRLDGPFLGVVQSAAEMMRGKEACCLLVNRLALLTRRASKLT